MQSVKNGFILIELLIVLSIIILSTGGGLAAYRSFTDRQTVLQEGRKVKFVLQQAKIDAQTGTQRDTVCSSKGVGVFMKAIRVDLVSEKVMNTQSECSDSPTSFLNSRIYTLPGDLIWTTWPRDHTFLEFNVLTYGITFKSPGDTTLCIFSSKNQTIKYKLVITQKGEINDAEIAPCP